MARSTDDYDESDVRIRPGRRGSRPRTKDRPAHLNAVSGWVVAVDRGRFTVRVGDTSGAHRVLAMRARELGRKGIVVCFFGEGAMNTGACHEAFNMAALWQLGPFVIHEYGTSRFAVIYLLSGIAGFVVSYFAGIPFTLGASASVCGLIGAILYYGKSRGGFYGQAVYKQAMGWTIGLILFGLLVQGINNWAHGGGIVGGIFLGFVLGYHEKKRETIFHKILGAGLILVTAVFLGSVILQALYIRFFMR